MCCMQTHVLSDVGLHCIVEEYILSGGLLSYYSSLMEKETKPAG